LYGLARTINQRGEIRGIHIGKEEIELFPSTDGRIKGVHKAATRTHG
jgi:hypothetical protein